MANRITLLAHCEQPPHVRHVTFLFRRQFAREARCSPASLLLDVGVQVSGRLFFRLHVTLDYRCQKKTNRHFDVTFGFVFGGGHKYCACMSVTVY